MALFRDENSTEFEINEKTQFTKIGNNQLVAGRHRLKYLTSKRRNDDFDRFTKRKEGKDESNKA